jgi:lipopolysaccharide export system protein LptA
LGLGAAAALCIASAAAAQVTAKRPIDLSFEHSEFVEGQHLVILTGKVEALQGDDRLRADLVKIYTKAGAKKASGGAPDFGAGMGGIERIEAYGNVYMVNPTETVRGDKAVYTAADDTTVVTGDVVLAQGENVGEGRRLVINRTTGTSTLDPAEGGRARVVLFPKEGDGAAK